MGKVGLGRALKIRAGQIRERQAKMERAMWITIGEVRDVKGKVRNKQIIQEYILLQHHNYTYTLTTFSP